MNPKLLFVSGLVVLSLASAAPSQSYEDGLYGATRDYGKSLDVGDPVSAASGAHHFRLPLLDLGGPLDLRCALHYRSDMYRIDPSLPAAFWWEPNARLTQVVITNQPYAEANMPNGDMIAWIQDTNNGTWALAGPDVTVPGTTYTDNLPRVQYRLQQTSSNFYLADPAQERLYVFESFVNAGTGATNWRIRRIADRNTNSLTYAHSNGLALVTNVSDGLGRSLELGYRTGYPSHLTPVRDHAGRQVVLAYEGSGADNDNKPTLRAITNAAGGRIRFGYGGYVAQHHNLIASNTLPRGNAPYRRQYGSEWMYALETQPRVVWEEDAYSNRTVFSYRTSTNPLAITDPAGLTNHVRHSSSHGLPIYLTDANGQTMHFAQDTNGRLRSVTDRLGGTTTLAYEPESGLLETVTNAAGHALRFVRTAVPQAYVNPDDGDIVTNTFYDLTRIEYPDGTAESFAYDGNGNLLVHSNRLGEATRYSYDGHGWATNIVNPAGGAVRLEWLPGGVVTSRAESGAGTNRYEYDALFRLTNIVFPDGSTVATEYDVLDRIVSYRIGADAPWQIEYDANGNPTRLTDPLGRSATYAYDEMDRLVAFTNRSGAGEAYTYDTCGRLESHTDPNGIRTEYGYNTQGRIDRYTAGGATWQLARNAEGLVETITTPLGHVQSYQYDVLGDVAAGIDPMGQAMQYARDDERRVTGVTDPLGRTNAFAYDTAGRLAQARAAGMVPALYRRNSLGLVDRITDPLGAEWAFSYTGMGRLQTRTDPLTNMWTYFHDLLGRRAGAVAPDGTAITNRYDTAGRVTNIAHSAGLNLSYAYDGLGQMTGAAGLFLQRDEEGRITNSVQDGISFGATYDPGGRLASMSCHNSALVVTYEYDPTNGLLQTVSDNLSGGGMRFAYDADRQPVSWIRSNGVTATFTWDAAARLVHLQDGAVLDLAYSRDSAGQVTQLVANAPLGALALIASAIASNEFDAASQLQTAGCAYDLRGRMTQAPGTACAWDSASRLTNLNGIAMAYNGLHELVARVSGGQTNEFFRNHAIRNAPIVAERENGVWTRYYVWTPGGALLYLVDVPAGHQPVYYHFDEAGSTRALTDAAGTITDAYAYDPFGRLLGRTGTTDQPFTFLGRHGVRSESSDGLYQMRARWYDARAGRFLSREPLWPMLALPAALNPYGYALNDPVGLVDANGLAPEGGCPVLQQLDQLAGEFRQAADASYSAFDKHSRTALFLEQLSKDPASEALGVWADLIGDPDTLQRRAMEATLDFWKAKLREREVRGRLLRFAGPRLPAVQKALQLVRRDLGQIREEQAQANRRQQGIQARLADLQAQMDSAESWHKIARQLDNAREAANALRDMMRLEKEMQDLRSLPVLSLPADPAALLESEKALQGIVEAVRLAEQREGNDE